MGFVINRAPGFWMKLLNYYYNPKKVKVYTYDKKNLKNINKKSIHFFFTQKLKFSKIYLFIDY